MFGFVPLNQVLEPPSLSTLGFCVHPSAQFCSRCEGCPRRGPLAPVAGARQNVTLFDPLHPTGGLKAVPLYGPGAAGRGSGTALRSGLRIRP